jgi:hypothetical protein
VGIDRPREPGESPGERPGRPEGNGRAETRSREEYYHDLRAAVARQGGARAAAGHAAGDGNGRPWHEVTGWSRRVWAEYQRKWPPRERPPGRRVLDREASGKVDEECDRIAGRERDRISPALREIESQAPDRRLVGFDHRLKGPDRIKEKVFEGIEENVLSPKEALALIPDAIRYTFQYDEARYTQGVWADTARLEEQGFQLVKRKNSWSEEQYKGINSQWVDPASGQRFEVQFHTSISFEAKQITHGAYERLRSGQADELERMVLKAFQREVSAAIPIPPGAPDIPDYP